MALLSSATKVWEKWISSSCGNTTMNPETRIIQQLRLDDAIAADEIFTTLMGEKVEPRREFIEANAKLVTNLDV